MKEYSVHRSAELQRAIDAWDAEVDAQAVRFIEMGYEPPDAMVRAKELVSRRRSAAYIPPTEPSED